ncbi:MAG: hypothetical protein V3580_01970 [Candidatus Cardinium sp.]
MNYFSNPLHNRSSKDYKFTETPSLFGDVEKQFPLKLPQGALTVFPFLIKKKVG